jgi:predicted dehydrogenase
MDSTVSLALVGCGALSEFYYAPALKGLSRAVDLKVAVLVDPNAERRAVLQKAFPSARAVASLAELNPGDVDAAIVASPQKFHAEQTIVLLSLGVHVLCEKPVASTADEARRMVEAATTHDRVLAVGLFRRFFPSSRLVHQLVQGGALGRPLSFEWVEGGVFNWPAATPSFFQKSASPSGVFADIGTHVLDLLLWWFGEPDSLEYADDAMGGIETNCRLALRFPNSVGGSIRLSRDTALANGTRIRFEHGWIGFCGASADSVTIGFNGSDLVGKSALHLDRPNQAVPPATDAALTYSQAFMAQIQNLVQAIRGQEPVQVTGTEAWRGLSLIERCYGQRTLLPMPWMSAEETTAAVRLQSAASIAT